MGRFPIRKNSYNRGRDYQQHDEKKTQKVNHIR